MNIPFNCISLQTFGVITLVTKRECSNITAMDGSVAGLKKLVFKCLGFMSLVL